MFQSVFQFYTYGSDLSKQQQIALISKDCFIFIKWKLLRSFQTPLIKQATQNIHAYTYVYDSYGYLYNSSTKLSLQECVFCLLYNTNTYTSTMCSYTVYLFVQPYITIRFIHTHGMRVVQSFFQSYLKQYNIHA